MSNGACAGYTRASILTDDTFTELCRYTAHSMTVNVTLRYIRPERCRSYRVFISHTDDTEFETQLNQSQDLS